MTTKIQQRVVSLHYTQFEKMSSLTKGIENSPENTENKQSRIEKTTFIYLFIPLVPGVCGWREVWMDAAADRTHHKKTGKIDSKSV